MRSRKSSFALLCVLAVAVLILSACPSDNNALRQVAVAAKDASSTVAVFQDAEIESFRSGVVDAEDHKLIQGLLVEASSIGKALNSGLSAANDNKSAIRVISLAVAQLDALEQDGTLHIKNKDVQMKWKIAMIGVRTTLNSVSVMLEAKPQ
jgi:hypothetical protein